MGEKGGCDPSEQTSIMVAPSRVTMSPKMVGPKYFEKASGGTKVVRQAARRVPRKSQRTIMRDSRSPLTRAEMKKRRSRVAFAQDSLISFLSEKSSSKSMALGFPGREVRFTKSETSHPVSTATNAEPAMKRSVHLMPIRENKMRVKEREFHGLAMRKASTWPKETPRS